MYYIAEAVADTNRYNDKQERRQEEQHTSSLYGSIPNEEGAAGALSSCLRHKHADDDEDETSRALSIDEAFQRLGLGIFQYRIMVAAGLTYAAEAMEFVILSFLSQILQKHWDLTDNEANNISWIVFPGALCGALVLGNLCDRRGRRPVFIFVAAIIAIFGMLTATVDTYEWIVFSRFMVGFGVGGLTIPFDAFGEFLPGCRRGRHLLYIQFFWIAGSFLVSIILTQEYQQNWRLVVFVCAIPSAISTIIAFWALPESPRWLLAKGMHGEALRVLRRAAVLNGKDPAALYPQGVFLYSEEPYESGSLISSQWIKITSLLFSTYFGLAFIFHGSVALTNSVPPDWLMLVANPETQTTSFQSNSTAIMVRTLSELVGLLLALLVIDKWGRITTQSTMYLCGGIFCLILSQVASQASHPILLVLLACVMRMCLFSGTCATWISTVEVLSTESRTSGHAYANAIGRVGAFLCSYMITFNLLSIKMIGGVMFVMSLWTVLSSRLLPETVVQKAVLGSRSNPKAKTVMFDV